MKSGLFIIFLLTMSLSGFGKDHPLAVKLKITPFKDTLVSGMENEITIRSEWDEDKFTLEGTNCSISVVDAKKGIYKIVTTEIGKTAVIKVIYKDKKGNKTTQLTKEFPIVRLSENMKTRYLNRK